MSTPRNTSPSDDLLRRIRAEYLEMPGLSLTSAQAERLWGLDSDTCGAVLAHLVESGFLWRTEADQYARLTEGTASATRFRMAKADLPRAIAHRIAI